MRLLGTESNCNAKHLCALHNWHNRVPAVYPHLSSEWRTIGRNSSLRSMPLCNTIRYKQLSFYA
jgi:hypothetical protein